MQTCSRHGSLYRSNVVRYSFHLTCLYGTDLCCTYLLAHLSLCLWPCEGHRANACLRLADGQVCGPTALTKLLSAWKAKTFREVVSSLLLIVVLRGFCYRPFWLNRIFHRKSSIKKIPPEPASTFLENFLFSPGGNLYWDWFLCTFARLEMRVSRVTRWHVSFDFWTLTSTISHWIPCDAMSSWW